MVRNKSRKKGTALVTGAAKRIGQGISLMLAEQGWNIALHYNHSKTEALQTANQIKKFKVRCEIFSCNLTNENQTLQLVNQVYQKFPNLELLVNSASIFEKSKFNTSQLDLFNQHFAVNLKAPFILSCAFSEICGRGQIINIVDTDIVKNKTSHVAYLLTKKSLADLTNLAAIEMAPHIRVNAIAPGLILPPKDQTLRYLDQRAKHIPLKRRGNVSYIAKSVKFLIDNDYLTGQFIFNDGGEHLV